MLREIQGHINHSLFWTNLAPANPSTNKPAAGGALEKLITTQFGSLENLITQFNAATAAIQGSGWGWVVRSSALCDGVRDADESVCRA